MNIEAVMKCIDDVLSNPLAGKGSLTVSELIRDRLTAMSATEPGGQVEPKKDATAKARKPRRTKAEMEAARAGDHGDTASEDQ